MLQDTIAQLGPIWDLLLAVLGALLILVVGYIIARVIAGIVRRLLMRVSVDNRIASTLGDEAPKISIEDIIAKAVFWILMLFVFVGVLQFLNLQSISTPFESLLTSITTVYLPRFIGAMILLFIAWVVASVLRLLVRKGATALRLDERLTAHAALEEGEQVSFGSSLATFVFWLVFLLFLPAVFEALGITTISEPAEAMFGSIMGYIPNILSAGIFLFFGWLIARIVRQVLSNLLASIGLDKLGTRAGLVGERSLSNLVGLIAYAFILLLALVSALEALNISAISDPAIRMITTILDAIPAIVGAALVLVIAYYVGRLVGNIVADLLRGFGFDTVPARLGFNWSVSRSPSAWVGYAILVAIMLLATLSATELLNMPFLSDLVADIIDLFIQVILATIIIGFGIYFGNLAYSLIRGMAGKQSNLLANLARWAIILMALAMGLYQLGVANAIVTLAFGAMIVSIGFAGALAFGLGGRETAGREVERIVAKLHAEEESVE